MSRPTPGDPSDVLAAELPKAASRLTLKAEGEEALKVEMLSGLRYELKVLAKDDWKFEKDEELPGGASTVVKVAP